MRGRGKANPWKQIQLPNAGHPSRTPASLRIDLHYAHLGIDARWNWNRFVRLANFLQLTPHELGSIVRITHNHVDDFQRTNRLKVAGAMNRCGTLLLTILEAHCTKAYLKDVIENPFPTLTPSA